MEEVPGGRSTFVSQQKLSSPYMDPKTRARKHLTMSKTLFCSHNKPSEIPNNSSKHAMEFLCRSWSPSASGFLHTLSSSSTFSLPESTTEEIEENEEKKETEKALKNAAESYGSTFNDKYNPRMDLKQTKGQSKGKSLTTFLRSRKEKKKEDVRFHTSKLHVALSLTRLAAAISSFATNGSPEPRDINNNGIMEWNQDMGIAVASAAALMTTVWAEAAEILGAHRTQVMSTINSGLAIRTPIDMVALTATAATCLRGAATLKSRALANFSWRQEILKAGAQICTLMPSGQKEYKWITIYLKQGELILSFKKKYLGGVLTTSKQYKAINIIEKTKEGHGCFSVSMRTNKGIIKLLFQDEMQSSIWISTISNLLVTYNRS